MATGAIVNKQYNVDRCGEMLYIMMIIKLLIEKATYVQSCLNQSGF